MEEEVSPLDFEGSMMTLKSLLGLQVKVLVKAPREMQTLWVVWPDRYTLTSGFLNCFYFLFSTEQFINHDKERCLQHPKYVLKIYVTTNS